MATKFCIVMSNIFGSSVQHLLHCHTSDTYNFELAPTFLENLCIPDIKYNNFLWHSAFIWKCC